MIVKFDSHFSERSYYDQVVWSKDGSVVAVRTIIFGGSGSRPKQYGPLFTGAYDFKEHKAMSFGDIRPLSKRIKQLLSKRGGEQKAKISKDRPLTAEEEKLYVH